MKKIKLSIIVPVYNSSKHLRKCLDSITNQNIKDFEIICINDGSTDDSLNILVDYQEKNNNIVIVNQKNMGVIEARKNGLKIAKGEYIAWVDSDDFIDEKMYSKMYDLAIKNNSDIVICNYNFFPNNKTNKEKWYKPINNEKLDYSLIQHNALLWNKIVKKELLDKINAIELLEKIGEDVYVFAMINANKISSIDECLYNYRVGHESLSSNFKKISWFEKVVEHQKNKIEYAKRAKYDQNWINFFEYNYLYYTQILMVVYAYNNNRTKYLNCKKTLQEGKIFSNKYAKYLKGDISFPKIIFLKYIGQHSFLLTKYISKIFL